MTGITLTERDREQIEADAHRDAQVEMFRELRAYLSLCERHMRDFGYSSEMVGGFADDVAAMLRGYPERVEKHRAQHRERVLASIVCQDW